MGQFVGDGRLMAGRTGDRFLSPESKDPDTRLHATPTAASPAPATECTGLAGFSPYARATTSGPQSAAMAIGARHSL